MYVLRAFPSGEIVHVYDSVDPVRDFEIVQSELILKDIESVEKRLKSVDKLARVGKEDAQEERKVLEKVITGLNEGIPAIDIDLKEAEKERISELWLLTSKPRMFILNTKEGVAEKDLDRWEEQLKEFVGGNEQYILRVDVKLIGEMESPEEYEEMLGYKPNTVGDVIEMAYKRLDLITFYTGSEKECNAWSIQRGASVKEAAGVIHTDLEQGFVTADVVNVSKLIETGGWVKAKEEGIVKNHGKDYTVEDGDYIIILANK
jgi:GTP-binding protein YchF